MKKGDVKNFLKEHKTDILLIALGGAIGVTGYHFGYKQGCASNALLKDGIVDNVLKDCMKLYDNHPAVFGGIDKDGIPIDKLGVVGEEMMKLGISPERNKATHFLVFGEPKLIKK